ncbi:MAG: hypothetical protein WBK70_02160 [Thermacetogeniaceae bacterium]
MIALGILPVIAGDRPVRGPDHPTCPVIALIGFRERYAWGYIAPRDSMELLPDRW